MNRDLLVEELKRDEGCIFEVYEDHLGYATCGVGHLVKDSDPEHGVPIGTKVDADTVDAYLVQDEDIAIQELERTFDWFEDLSDARQRVCVNMCFNLGLTRLLGFKKFIAAMEAGQWETAGVEMLDSKWSRQVGDRSIRLRDLLLEG